MCFSAKLLMDCFLLLMLVPAVLTGQTGTENRNNTVSSSTSTPSTPLITSSEPTSKPDIELLPPAVGRIKVKWDEVKLCRGYIYFYMNFTCEGYLCYQDYIVDTSLGTELCKERRCGEFLGFKNSEAEGYLIHENLTVSKSSQCMRTFLTCNVSKECNVCKDADRSEPVVYKVITGLLLTLIIGVLLCRFLQPTYIAVRKRFSQKQQNRWIGPTQSQSVCYHRGQASHPNNNTKRQSYPGLERLSVNPSREPSSNRNSDYDSYGV